MTEQAQQTDFDLVVIGGGPGGYVAAIRAAQLGMTVACVDRRAALGGACLNVGCISSKALLYSSSLYEDARLHFAAHGIRVRPELDLATMQARKEKVVADLAKGIGFLFKKNAITQLCGSARLDAPRRVAIIDGPDQGRTLTGRAVLIATGSEPTPLSGVTVDERRIVSSTGALALDQVPESLTVIGGGVIGLELGSVWRRLGAQVTVVEYLDRILPGMDGEVATTARRLLQKQGMVFRLATKVEDAVADDDGVLLTLAPAAGGAPETLRCAVALACVGRRPYVEGLGLEALGVARDQRGFIVIDDDYRTSVPGVYAVGDCVPGPMLAHKAEEEGVICVERLAGSKSVAHYDAIPAVVYTHPEIAEVGANEETLKQRGIDYKVGKFALQGNSRARAVGDSDGFVKLLAARADDRLLGAQLITAGAGEMIHELALALTFGAAAEDVARLCHAHPTLSEAVREAALATQDGALHA